MDESVVEIVLLRIIQFTSYAVLVSGGLMCIGYKPKKMWILRLIGFIVIISAIVILGCVAKLVGFYIGTQKLLF